MPTRKKFLRNVKRRRRKALEQVEQRINTHFTPTPKPTEPSDREIESLRKMGDFRAHDDVKAYLVKSQEEYYKRSEDTRLRKLAQAQEEERILNVRIL